MVRKSSKARPKRPSLRLGAIDTAGIAERLRELHRLGDDPEFERFPDPAELFLMLRHAERMAGELKQPTECPVNVVAEAAVLRAELWQFLREQADRGQLKAIETGRSAGVPWHHFAQALCVTSKQGAYQKARRLKAEQVRDPGERRTPEVARDHEKRVMAEERAERAQVLVQERRFPLAQRIGRLLLEHRDGMAMDSWSTYWLGELAETIDNRDDATKRARFTGWVESFVRAIQAHARERNQPATTTEGARQALALATEFTCQERP
ncbi:hypothetical protein ACIHCQ_32635 [Streptomyces sp. NPDC052236]|uniref:hypothetical protein n=1 Tax=Streptomyces sp. NPDC052236 TaxID=3365686 RepID=UPI0037D7C036